MSNESKHEVGELLRRIEQLESTIDRLVSEIDNTSQSEINVTEVKQTCPNPPEKRIEPPWEQDGYDSKRKWMQDKGDN